MSATLDFITILGTAIGIYGLIPSLNFPHPNTTMVPNAVQPWIADFGGNHNAGNPGTIDSDAAGKLFFAGRTPKNQVAGTSIDPVKFSKGSVAKYVSLEGKGSQMGATSLQVTGPYLDDAAVCIVGITMTEAGDANQWAWSGDSWKGCPKRKYQWHHGGKVGFGKLKTGSRYKDYYPSCMWLGSPKVGCLYFEVVLGMANYVAYHGHTSVHELCHDQKFINVLNQTGTGEEIDSIPVSPTARPFQDNLIVSDIIEHSAIELCESPTSLGPDFVNLHENLYCDMGDKSLWPLCTTQDQGEHCFRLDHNATRLHSTDETIKPTRQFKEIVYHILNETAWQW